MDTKIIDEHRARMGTNPSYDVPRDDTIYTGVKGIRVELVDWPTNPYRAIYELVTSTWGSRKGENEWWNKWDRLKALDKMAAVIAVLQGDTLPNPLEAPSFTFKIEGLSRSSFDQLARNRYSNLVSLGTRDNSHKANALRVPKDITKDPTLFARVKDWWRLTKDLYVNMIESPKGEMGFSWETGRFMLPMGITWAFTWTMNYRSLKDECGRRLGFHEQSDTVAVVWLMRKRVEEKFPLLASFLRPSCDWAGKCLYHKCNSASENFGCLFKSCGRQPEGDYSYATWDQPCCKIEDIESDLEMHIPRPNEWDDIVRGAMLADRKFFGAK